MKYVLYYYEAGQLHKIKGHPIFRSIADVTSWFITEKERVNSQIRNRQIVVTQYTGAYKSHIVSIQNFGR